MWSGSAVAVLAIPLVLLASGSCDDSSAKDIVIRTIPINLDQLKHLQDLWLQDVDIENFLRRASSQFYYVDLIDFGDSFEGRDLWVLRINKPNSNGAAKKVVWLDAISSSSNPCKETYHGSRAFSEPETAAASQYISRLSPKPTMYLSLHSYSQLILLSYGMHWKPADYNELIYIAKLAEAEIERVGGGKWDSVSVFEKFGYISGGAHDWAKAKAGIKYSYTFELRDRGNYGFLLPPGQIIPAAKETWAGILAMMKFLS
ncbi:unnamed protein product [Cyprideis torosa]|uniref:Peptidase M14 domain-containing protein n=1 Tax=Cyprideis torosa TaxID=163714 RepID=A0A7R8ZJ82_9CRUS|nr:unnamed protein product [Cyprideis torosa]CAG0879289.1 unnamed protein product [Cyprideis torosa]